jgi:type I restriction enzyme, S subunit
MSLTPIKELCTPINSINWKQHESNSFEYLDISSIDRESKKIITTTTTLKTEAPSRARQPVITSDILVSTVRANLNAVAIVESTYDKSIASTGFCILRPQKDKIDPHFLFYFTRTKRFVDQLVKLSTGASYPAVSDKIVKSLKIPLPPLKTQKRIVEILDKAQALIDKRKEQIALMDQLIQSLFYDMFGDPVSNPKGWEVKFMKDICHKVTDGTHDTPERLTEGVKFITGKHIRPSKVDYENSDYVTQDVHKEIYRRCNPENGDVLYTNIGVNLGTAAMNTVDYEFSMKNVALLKCKKKTLYGKYLEQFLNSKNMKANIVWIASIGGAQKFLSLTQIRKLKVAVPPIKDQKSFADRVQKIETQKAAMTTALKELQNNFNALMQGAFKGELV